MLEGRLLPLQLGDFGPAGWRSGYERSRDRRRRPRGHPTRRHHTRRGSAVQDPRGPIRRRARTIGDGACAQCRHRQATARGRRCASPLTPTRPPSARRRCPVQDACTGPRTPIDPTPVPSAGRHADCETKRDGRRGDPAPTAPAPARRAHRSIGVNPCRRSQCRSLPPVRASASASQHLQYATKGLA